MAERIIQNAIIYDDALNIFTDGSSLGKPRTGGIAVRFVMINSSGEEQLQDFDFDGYTLRTLSNLYWQKVEPLRTLN